MTEDDLTIPVAELEHGCYYRGHCRNALLARWDASTQYFFHWREKFGQRFVERIRHPEHEKRFDVFLPKAKVEPPAEAIPLDAR